MAPHIESPAQHQNQHQNPNQNEHPPSSPPPPPSTSTTTSSLSTTLHHNRLPLLLTAYTTLTALLMYRVSRRSPFSQSRKWEQYETIFKATTLGAVVVGIGLGGGLNRRRSEVVALKQQDEQQQGDQAGETEEQRRKEEEMARLRRGWEGREDERREKIARQGVQRD